MFGTNKGTDAIGKALSIDCPRCSVAAGEKCRNPEGATCPPHVERGRTARWLQMYGETFA